ncbi:DUF1007 family protein [Microvirga pudoricolor]|uniref:DUF1007 family protein n=1 Tax=Microvirga pudoricolor TaxID=2778729 RepID=UPI0019519932|nr:DUF1007 family protein [Microvirga pudoricolor]MBM6594906.1 DUF1007 family protein [Microvirga pudoricolor]
MNRRLGPSRFLVLLAGLLLAAFAVPAWAHPHVFVTARSEVVFSPEGTITGVRHFWSFDEAYSSYVTQGLDKNADGKLTPDELLDLAKENTESLVDFDYFTFVKVNGRKQAFGTPRDPAMAYENERVVLSFFLPLAKPVPASSIFAVEVTDPTFFVYFEMSPNKDAVKLASAPAGCSLTVAKAVGLDMSQQQAMADNTFPIPSGEQYSNKAIVTCP